MKNLKFILSLFVLSSVLVLTQCEKVDYSAKSVSGVATLETGMAANGAVVYLSTEPNAANVVFSAIAGTDGSYSFSGLAKGTYYLSAKYNTENTNNANKMTSGFMFMTAADMDFEYDGSAETVDLSLVGNAADGDAKVDMNDGWVYDGTHSNINFEFPYDVENAPFKGLFGEAGFENFVFDEANPANTAITAWVYLPSVETGSPTVPPGHGRDDINGCIQGTFGVTPNAADTIATGEYAESAASNETHTGTGYARLTTKTVTAFGDGYMAVCDFEFHGKKGEVKLYFKYIEGFQAENRSGDLTQFSSFEGFFDFEALAGYDINSGHVGDAAVTVDLGIQWTKTL